MYLSRHPTSYPTRYQEIAARLEQELRHHYRCGDYLPAEQQMAARFEVAADQLNLDSGLRKYLCTPNREIIVHIPVQLDSGKLETFDGYRVQHSIARGPCKGGIRYGPDVSLERQDAYMEACIGRLARLGVEVLVFGSGGARNIPDGFSRAQALDQLVADVTRVEVREHQDVRAPCHRTLAFHLLGRYGRHECRVGLELAVDRKARRALARDLERLHDLFDMRVLCAAFRRKREHRHARLFTEQSPRTFGRC